MVLSRSEESNQGTESSESDGRTADTEHGATVAGQQSRVRSADNGGGWRLTRGRGWGLGISEGVV